MSGKKRLHVTVSEENYNKCEEVANRYGITVNAFMAFIIGQWIDLNYDANQIVAKKVDEAMPDLNTVLSNPALLSMVQQILGNDQEFKDSARKKLSI